MEGEEGKEQAKRRTLSERSKWDKEKKVVLRPEDGEKWVKWEGGKGGQEEKSGKWGNEKQMKKKYRRTVLRAEDV